MDNRDLFQQAINALRVAISAQHVLGGNGGTVPLIRLDSAEDFITYFGPDLIRTAWTQLKDLAPIERTAAGVKIFGKQWTDPRFQRLVEEAAQRASA